jgi:hypothetical protein
MATLLTDGSTIEAATIGGDRVVGVEGFFEDDAVSAGETIVQVSAPEGSAEQIRVQDFRRALAAHPALHRAVAR